MIQQTELDWLSRWAHCSPDKVALTDKVKGDTYTYQELYQISNGLIPFLRRFDIQTGDRVAVFANNCVETILLFFTLQRLGATLVPINFRLSTSELSYILQDADPKLLFFDEMTAATVKRLATPCLTETIAMLRENLRLARLCHTTHPFQTQANDPTMILYTSGTTGNPKGVVITPEILFWNSINTTMSLNISSDDSFVSFLPLFHTGGWNVLLTPFVHRGASFVFVDKFDADQILRLCNEHRLTVLFGVPTTLALLAKSPMFSRENLSSLRFAVAGGEPMPLSLIQVWHNLGVPVRQGFGLTECGPNCFSLSHLDAERKIGSIGKPNFYVNVRVLNEAGEDCKDNEIGELLLQGPMCMQTYWRNDISSREAFYNGWLKTGDLVRRDGEGYYYVVGRKKDMFISGGENVYPAEVEKVLSLHPAVDEVAVIGTADDKWGEVGSAFVVTKAQEAVSPDDLISHCIGHLAKFKVPKHFNFLNELPKGSSGKILKKDLSTRTNNPPQEEL